MANFNINEFTAAIDKWCDAAGDGLQDAVETMLRDVHRDLVRGSPVDTGLFRGNWQVTVNRIPLYAIPRRDPDGNETIAEGNQVISRIFTRGAAVTSVHFSNMLIYANALEYGHSQQAPNGVVGIVAIRLRSYMANAIKESRARHAL